MIAVSPRLALYACAAATAAIVIGTLYVKLERAERDAASLRVARETIRFERETLKITSRIDMRVNLETTQTARRAEDADREIAKIREMFPRRPECAEPTDAAHIGSTGVSGVVGADAHIVQIAWEARNAATASSARLQPADPGAR